MKDTNGVGLCTTACATDANCNLDAACKPVKQCEDTSCTKDSDCAAYSTGMGSRLRFAIASARSHEVLLIDEALVTGDAEFRVKSRQRIEELRAQAGTVFIVAHSMAQIEETCRKYLRADEFSADRWKSFTALVDYVTVDATQAQDFRKLATALAGRDDVARVIFLSTAPSLFTLTCDHLAAAGLVTPKSRVVLEKPLGQDRASAEKLYRRALAIDDSIYGPDDPELATDLVNLGQLLKEMGQSEASDTSLNRALAIYERAFGANSPQARQLRQTIGSRGK